VVRVRVGVGLGLDRVEGWVELAILFLTASVRVSTTGAKSLVSPSEVIIRSGL